ncbi:MAG: DUF5820 family protein [Halobacteriales archaeon]
MRTWEDLPDGWQVWTDEDGGRAVLVYRPDVFDGGRFDAGCLPTLYLTRGPPDRRRPRDDDSAPRRWNATLFLEPEVAFDERPAAAERPAAVDAAVELAERFAAGELDLREPYQLPREDYLAELDRLTG